MDHHLNSLHALIFHHVLGDLARNGFDQIAGRPSDNNGRPLGQDAVVVGVCQAVAGRGIHQVNPDTDIDDEILTVRALMVEDPVSTANRQAAQFDSVSHRILPPRLASTPGPP